MSTVAIELGAPNLTPRQPPRPGDVAPDFRIQAVDGDRVVSLADYRGRTALMLVIERGLYCPFCRKHLAQIGLASAHLRARGVEVLAVFGTPADRARAYFARRPPRVPVAADPMHEVHSVYGLPRFAATPQTEARVDGALVDPFGDQRARRPLRALADELSRDDPYEWTSADETAYKAGQIQTTGQFVIDRDGIVRWRNVEGMRDGLAGLGHFPSEKELLAAIARL